MDNKKLLDLKETTLNVLCVIICVLDLFQTSLFDEALCGYWQFSRIVRPSSVSKLLCEIVSLYKICHYLHFGQSKTDIFTWEIFC